MGWQVMVPAVTEALEELTNLRVCVEEVIYMPSLDAPEDRPHPFVDFSSIANESGNAVTIKGRKWVITRKTAKKSSWKARVS